MIHIGQDWYIDRDDNALSIKRRQLVKTGKTKGTVRWTDQTWHSTFSQLKSRVAVIATGIAVDKDFKWAFEILDGFVNNEKDILKL